MPLPTSQPTEIRNTSLAASVARDGFAFLKGWQPETSSTEVASRAGTPLAFRAGGTVHCIVPKQEAEKNTYSGMYGLNDFPFHTDMAHWPYPPRYLMLRCLKGHESVKTILIDGKDVITHVQAAKLSRALVKPRRPLNGTFPLLTLYRPPRRGRASLLRWDENFIVPASNVGKEGMDLVKGALTSMPANSISLSNLGDTLVIDNWRMLHRRSAVLGEQTDRIIERAYLGDIN